MTVNLLLCGLADLVHDCLTALQLQAIAADWQFELGHCMLACCLPGDLGLDWKWECVDDHQSSRAGSTAGQRRPEVKEGTWQTHPHAEINAKS